MNLTNFPKELLHMILEYDGRIKYRNGRYINQINIKDEKYNSFNEFIKNKIYMIKHTIFHSNGSFLIDVTFSNKMYGFMYWNYYNTYIISFYKNPINSLRYTFVDVYYTYLNYYLDDIDISVYEYK